MFRPYRLYSGLPQSQYSRHENVGYQFALKSVIMIFSFFISQYGCLVSETRLKNTTDPTSDVDVIVFTLNSEN